MAETRTEFEVVYFPPLESTKHKKVADLAAAQALCSNLVSHGCNPIIQRRTVTVTEWEIVENYAVAAGREYEAAEVGGETDST